MGTFFNKHYFIAFLGMLVGIDIAGSLATKAVGSKGVSL